MPHKLPDFLPGRLILSRGSRSDYLELEQFHYIPKRPATWADVWTIRYLENRTGGRAERGSAAIERVIAIGVLSYCVPRCRLRERYFHIEHFSYKQHCRFVNQNLRIISRVIVHPQFRSLGLSTILVRHLCKHCPTRYVESIAMMARAHPFFENAGMTRIDPDDPRQPVYFIFDRRHASV